MTAVSTSSANKRRALYRNLMIGMLILVPLVTLISRTLGVHVHGLASVLMVSALALAVLQFNALDEVAKQAHYVAWMWGSMVVMGLFGVIMAVLYALPGPITIPVEAPLVNLFGDAHPDTAFLAGFIASPFLVTIGFAVWWAVYWLRRR